MIGLLSLAGIGTYYLRYYAMYLLVCAAVIVVVRWRRRRLAPWVRGVAVTFVTVLLVRLVLFDNPFALRMYQTHLTALTLGMRQGGVLDLEIVKYRRDIHQRPLANLAVGSS